MSYDFFAAHCDEAYGLVSRQNWMTLQGVSPRQEKLDDLVMELEASTSS
jgi:hypothetical protein